MRHLYPLQPWRPAVQDPLALQSAPIVLKQSKGSFYVDTARNTILDFDVGAQAPLGYNHVALYKT